MAKHDEELIEAARRIVARDAGQRGRLPSARIRRSISTSYYAIFHFIIEEASKRLIGVQNDLLRRRRIFSRQFTHAGVRLALDRVRGTRIHASVEQFLWHPAYAAGGLSPRFVQDLAGAFLDAQSKRYDADYDLNEALSEADARLLTDRVEKAIRGWRQAQTAADRDFKDALCTLMLLGGKLRSED
jgi:hypothetical protein